MDLSDLLRNCRTYSAEQSSAEQIPAERPAVYAFFDLFRFDHTKLADDIDRFKTLHARSTLLEEDGLPEKLHIRLRGNPERFKGEGKRLWDTSEPARQPEICRTLMFLSFLNEPLYIGKTNDMRTRFRAHHDNGFLFDMKKRFKRSPDEFMLFVYFCEESETRLLESILIQLINPFFCDQKT